MDNNTPTLTPKSEPVVEQALKPCPFCGSYPCPDVQNDDCPLPGDYGKDGGRYYQVVWCANCGGEGGKRETEAKAIEAWNTRALTKHTASLPSEPGLVLEWRDGPPPKPWSEEWFIAQTTFNDRVVLTALPEEYSYDFKTADETYIKADKIKRWMQFPDSQFIAPTASLPSDVVERVVKRAADIVSGPGGKYEWLADRIKHHNYSDLTATLSPTDASDERGLIVAHIRNLATEAHDDIDPTLKTVCAYFGALANELERGDHLQALGAHHD